MLIKAYKDHVQVKILTFKAQNIENIVRCFFDEVIEHDNPEVSVDSTVETISDISSPDTSAKGKATFVSRMSKFLSSTLEVFNRNPTPDQTPTESTEEQGSENEIVIYQDDQEKEEDHNEGEEGDKEGRGNAN